MATMNVKSALEKGMLVVQSAGQYQCACGEELKESSLRNHLKTQKHLEEVHARKLWMKSVDEEANGARTNSNGSTMRVEYDDDSARCHYCGEKLTNKEYLKRHLQNKRCKEKINRKREVANTERAPKEVTTPYVIRSNPPGHVYVFNNDFKGKGQGKERDGAEHDSQNLRTTFEAMGYKVILRPNLGAQQTMEEVDRIRQDSALAHVDALVMVFLSHGIRPFKFQAQDWEILSLQRIRRQFTHSLCPHLKGKPKIFFTNFCRGRRRQIQTDGDVEATRDMVTIHAVQQGIVALRDCRLGTRFVRALCEVLREHAATKSLREIYLELARKSTEIKGTLPQWEADVFREFYFMQQATNRGQNENAM
ncbi:caspase-3 isoform X3 [Penaeus vannamei]|uniref:caspase-3 isoform X3 n=1 Tax=Penaeus vannamei TaxID=6689 RepID=UPI000F672FE9|nr:caspase-1-like isoform X3 [Penaeus vannamei]